MRGMELPAHERELPGELRHLFRLVAGGAGIGFLAQDALETDAVASVLRDHVLAGFGGRDAHFVDLAGQLHLVQGLPDLAREIQFEHDGRVRPVVIAFPVGASAKEDIIVQRYPNGFFHYANT